MKKISILPAMLLLLRDWKAPLQRMHNWKSTCWAPSEFQDAKITGYSIRTLQRDIKEIASLFNLNIHNKRKATTVITLRVDR